MSALLEREFGIEAFDKDWGTGKPSVGGKTSPFERINEWRMTFLETPLTLDDERAVLYTEKMKTNENKPQIIRVAEGFYHVMKNITIHINEWELFVGNMAAPPRCSPVFPEFSFDWFIDEMEKSPFNERINDRFLYDEKVEEGLKSIHDYWKSNTVHDLAKSMMDEDTLKGTAAYGKGVFMIGNYFYGGVGHVTPRYNKILKIGMRGLREQVEGKMAQLSRANPEDMKKRNFYEAQLISLDAFKVYCDRYAEKAREVAKDSKEPRKAELLRIAANCEWVAENPPRDFWEAIQLTWLLPTVCTVESNGHSMCYERFDQYLYPYYKKAMADGSLSKEQMQEMIECFFIKVSELTKIRDAGSTKAFGGVELGGPSLTVGGQTPEGLNAVNELSYMCVDGMAHVRLNAPWMVTRHFKNEPEEWWVKCTNCAKIGFGLPSFFNDDIIIQSLLQHGLSIEDARDYNPIGCVEADAGGREYGWHDAAFFSLNRVLELAINNGTCINCSSECMRYDICKGAGKQLGVTTGYLSDMKSFDEVKVAYEKQMEFWIDGLTQSLNACDIAHQTIKPLPYLSLLVEDCIEKGMDVTAGGARYNFIGPQGIGVGNVADCLSTIKKLIFDDKKITGEELLEALRNNWEGYETLYALVNSPKVPHYGNNDDYADLLARYAGKVYCTELEKHATAHGGIFQAGLYPVSSNVAHGALQGASADGRKAGEAIADGVSPVHTSRGSHDVSGPTAYVQSVAKLDHAAAGNGTLLNQKFTTTTLKGEMGTENFITMMKEYFNNGGWHNQINVTSRAILEDALAHPENYKDLLIRVAGYSAFFTELDPGLQQDLINRTELEF